MREGDKKYVLVIPGFRFGVSLPDDQGSALEPRRVEVTLGDDYRTVIQWTFRELRRSSEPLQAGEMLIRNPRPECLNGVTIAADDWVIRPGDLVSLSFRLGSRRRGIYVPVEAIVASDGRPSVFVVEGERARKVEVRVGETHHELRRIEGEGIQEGVRIVFRGVHYVADGERVSVVDAEHYLR
jgi:hypothetical protein